MCINGIPGLSIVIVVKYSCVEISVSEDVLNVRAVFGVFDDCTVFYLVLHSLSHSKSLVDCGEVGLANLVLTNGTYTESVEGVACLVLLFVCMTAVSCVPVLCVIVAPSRVVRVLVSSSCTGITYAIIVGVYLFVTVSCDTVIVADVAKSVTVRVHFYVAVSCGTVRITGVTNVVTICICKLMTVCINIGRLATDNKRKHSYDTQKQFETSFHRNFLL